MLDCCNINQDGCLMVKARSHGGRRAGAGRPQAASTTVVRLPLPVAAFARRLASGRHTIGDVAAFLTVEARGPMHVPLATSGVPAGFPSPADDHIDRPLDFNELLIENPAATFAVRIQGDSMTGAGIFPDDIAVVDRSKSPTNGCIVLALLDGAFTVKRFRRRGDRMWLQAENKDFADMPLNEESAFEVWGVVTKSIRMF
jgi:DNA polymerase V